MFLVTMFTRVSTVGVYSAFCFVTSAFSNLPFLANTSENLFLTQASCFYSISLHRVHN
jgi:hypothetical protein